jgi:hypothetical protein
MKGMGAHQGGRPRLHRGGFGEENVQPDVSEFEEGNEDFIIQSAAEMYNMLFNITTSDASAVLRRSAGLLVSERHHR